MPAATRTEHFPLRREISEIPLLGVVGTPGILMASQAHIYGLHQKVIIRREVIRNAVSS